ncbi:MAG: hypothetical protein KF914_15850 [Rhizobiaceae bacterium]|nr:hypothetical protein [Rhizobiaceae bacterium]
MADFVAVLKKTLDGLSDASPQMREKVYEKARLTIASKLAAMNPPPPAGVIDRQKRALEDAIAQIEKEFAPAKPKPSDPLAELEDVFASLKNPDPTAMLRDSQRARPASSAPPPAAPVQARPAPAPASIPAAKPVVPAPRPAPPVSPSAAAPQPARPAVSAPAAVTAATSGAAMPAAKAPAVPQDAPRPNPSAASMDELFTDVPDEDMADTDYRQAGRDERPRRGGAGRLVLAAVIVAALAGGAYGAWINRDTLETRAGDLLASLGIGAATPPAEEPSAAPEAPASDVASAPAEQPEGESDQPTAEAATPEQPAGPAAEEPATAPGLQKYTQRLNADGTEVDAGPAGGAPSIGEGTSLAAVTEPPVASMDAPSLVPPAADTSGQPAPAAPAPADQAAAAPADAPAAAADPSAEAPADAVPPADTATAPDAAPAADTAPLADAAAGEAAPASPAPTAGTAQALPVGQRAIFYEERTNVAEASAEPGNIVWSIVQESPGGDLPPEPAIRAEATIPGKDVQLRMTIRRNADRSLPASHIIEMIFLTPQGFEGGGIDNVLRVSLKGSEQEAGSPLLGIPAKIADGFFLIALNDAKPDIAANTSLLGRQSWIDVPVQYKSGRRALFTMEKGIPGTKVFDEALKAWQAASSG